jgi:hypothetical protein
MHKRVVGAVSMLVFALLAALVVIVADLHDRSYPQGLNAKASVNLDFSDSGLTDEEAFRELGVLSEQWRIGIVKVAPDLTGEQSGQVFVGLSSRELLPSVVRRFGNEPDTLVKDRSVLEHSFASGEYLVTRDTTHLSELKTWLASHRVANRWAVDTVSDTLGLLMRQTSFLATVGAAIALMVSLVLYWLSVRSRGRALRVLAGVSAWRIQYEDIAGFMAAMLVAGVVGGAVAAAYVGLAHGWMFVPYYVSTLGIFDAVVLVGTAFFTAVLSVASAPSVRILAAREPAVTRLRSTSALLKSASFMLVLAAAGPALTAYTNASAVAAQQATWKSLSEQVSIVFPAALDEERFQAVKENLGDVVADAEARGSVALSYLWTSEPAAGRDFGPDRNLAMVNQRWLNLMHTDGQGHASPGLVTLRPDELPASVKQYLDASLPLWLRHPLSGADALAGFTFYRYSGSAGIPMNLPSGQLQFPDTAIVMVAPGVHSTFNDNFLGSVLSTRNLVLTGLGPTQALVASHGLQGKVYVKYVAEQGILMAQFTAYLAWLSGLSLASLIVALAISAGISAFIVAVMKARHDFPLRLAGHHWRTILAGRVSKEWFVGGLLAAPVIATQGRQGAALVGAAAAACLLISPLMHLVAARWSFTNVSQRKL